MDSKLYKWQSVLKRLKTVFQKLTSLSTSLYFSTNLAIMESIFPAEIIQARLMTGSACTPHQIFSVINGGGSPHAGASHHASAFPCIGRAPQPPSEQRIAWHTCLASKIVLLFNTIKVNRKAVGW